MARSPGLDGFSLLMLAVTTALIATSGASAESLTVSVDTPTNTSLVVVEFGDTVSIDCIASTTGVDVDYEWMKVNLTTDDSVTVSTNQTLSVSFLTSSEEAGYYYCRVTISPTLMDVVNVSEVVLVVFAPTFVMHPSSNLTSMDMSIQLQCMATGFPQPDIEWIRLDSNNNTVDLPSFSNITYTGSTSILTIDVETDDFGSYRCITTPPTSLPGNLSALSSFNVSLGSASGSGMQSLYTTLTPVLGSDLTDSSLENLTASSMIAVLTVSPEVVLAPSEQTTDNGSTITINCTVEGGPDNVFQWIRVGEPMLLSSGENLNISFNESYSVLTISNINATQHGGVYRCVVSNAAGNDSDNGTLNVRPVITVQPAETILTNNRDMEQLQCVADAFPAPEYRWEMIEDGVVIETVSNTSVLMFNPVMFGDEGTYQCVAVSLGVQVNSTSSLVTVSPEGSVSIQPVNLTVSRYDNASFNCDADGGPNNTFRWIRGDVDLDNLAGDMFVASIFLQNLSTIVDEDWKPIVVEEGPLLNISSVIGLNSGQYTCVVVNEAGFDSDNTTLFLRPALTSEPSDRQAVPGDDIILSCLAESFPEPVFQWEKLNGGVFETVFNETRNFLDFTDVQHEDSGVYRCVATAPGIDGEAVSRSVTLTVSPLGSVSVTPLIATEDNDGSTTFTCTASGGPNNTIVWIRGSDVGSSSGSGSPGSFDSMAFLQQLTNISTGPNLTISSINATQDGGMYTCVVVNQAGQDSANVTLYVRPLIVDQPQDQFTRQGETVTLSCRADSFPSPLYQWEKFNTTSESYYQLPGETNRTLEFSSVEFDDLGDYRCVATAPVIGDTATSINATITVAPGVSVTPLTATEDNDGNTTFTCTVSGGPDNNIVWIRGSDVGSSSGSGLLGSFDSIAFLRQFTTLSTGPNLTISSINATQDGGMYTCVVVNQAGQDSANVTLYVRPLIVDQPQDQFTRQGETVTLSCRADSFPSPLYQWEKFNTTSESYYQLSGETNRTLEFSSVEFDDFGDYRCVATAPVIGDTDTSDNATITVSPAVVLAPSEQTTDNGSTITINCSVEGGPDNVFQWIRVGEPMMLSSGENLAISSNESYSVLTISNVNATQHGGVYRCVVSNAAGNDSDNGTLNVRPVITVQPAEFILTSNGDMEQLQCVADAFPAPEYRWEKIENGVTETVSNASILMFNPVMFGDEGTYQCVAVSLGVQVNSTSSLVTVSPSGSVMATPLNATEDNDGSTTFTCTASGGPGNTIVWIRGSDVGSSSGSGLLGSFDSMTFLQQLTNISTGPNLTISSINATQDGGMYTCVVVNQAGQDSANVTLYVRPLIVDQPQDQFTRQGETVTLSCRADSFPSPLYQWKMFNTTSESYYQLPGETNRTLEFSSVEFDDFGDYRCVATAPVIGDTDTSINATITVSPEGNVTATPAMFNANRTQQADFTCSGQGGPDNMFQWILTRDGTTVSNTNELSLNSTAMIGGDYQCTVSNQAGNESQNVTLNVRPKVVLDPVSINVTRVEDNITLSCSATGFPAPAIVWYHNNTAITTMGRVNITSTSSHYQTNSTITITNATTNDTGDYYCNITSSVSAFGPISSSVALVLVQAIPEQPDNLMVVNVTSRNLTLTWVEPHNNNAPITGYRVSYAGPMFLPDGDNVVTVEAVGNKSVPAQLFINNLHPGATYNFTVVAFNGIGNSTPSEPLSVTLDDEAPGGVLGLSASPVAATTATLMWDPLADIERRANAFNGYFVNLAFVRLLNASNNEEMCLQLNSARRDRSYSVLGETINLSVDTLVPYAEYQFTVVANTSFGVGENLSSMTFNTLTAVPTPPTQVIAVNRTSSAEIQITWERPACDNGVLLGYTISHETNVSDGVLGSPSPPHNVTDEVTTQQLISLTANTQYSVSVSARTSAGSSNETTNTTTTSQDAPQDAINVTATEVRDGVIDIMWTMPSERNGSVSYNLSYTGTQPPPYPQEEARTDTSSFVYNSVSQVTHTITSALSFAIYNIEVFAYNTDLGQTVAGTTDSAIINRTFTTDSSPVRDVVGTTIGHDRVLLVWDVPLSPNGEIDQYQVNITQLTSGNSRQRQIGATRTLSTTTTSITITGLTDAAGYNITVQPIAVGGDRGNVIVFIFTVNTTAPNVPPPVQLPPEGIQPSTLTVPLPRPSSYGTVLFYGVAVARRDTDGCPANLGLVYTTLGPYTQENSMAYITAAWSRTLPMILADNDVPSTLIIGNGTMTRATRPEGNELIYINQGLSPAARYCVFIVTQQNTSIPGVYQTSYSVLAEVATPLGYSPGGIAAGFIISLLVIAIVVVVIVVVVIYLKRYKGKDLYSLVKRNGKEGSVACRVPPPEENLVIMNSTNNTEAVNGTWVDPSSKHQPIHIKDFPEHVQQMHANDDYLFSVEYPTLEPKHKPTTEATHDPDNAIKNRYANITAYDHSRVKLQEIPNTPGSDYINSNYLDAYKQPNGFIASQGPVPYSVPDFWRMIWEQGTATVVMLTNLEEKGRIKCHKYWPDSSGRAMLYGHIRVQMQEELVLSEHTIRTFSLQRENSSDERIVKQYHFTAWPDFGVPEHPTPVLSFVRKVTAANPVNAGPMIVHCSAGVGRTGTFCTIMTQMKRITDIGTIDIFNYVQSMRHRRCFMVQTEPQYIFIHDALLEVIECGETEVTAREVKEQYGMLDTILELEFEKLQTTIHTEPIRIAGLQTFNKMKNRYANVIPFDKTRCRMSAVPGIEGSDYINANYIEGYHKGKAFIATQGPLPDTADDFWRMVWEQKSATIVVLAREREGGKAMCHRYWPDAQPQMYGAFEISVHSVREYPEYTLREFKIVDTRDLEGSSQHVKQFQYTGWPSQGVPSSAVGLIDLREQVEKWQRNSGDKPIVIHCSGGCGRTGTYIAICLLIDRLKTEGVVDVFQTVRALRLQRPGMVRSTEQYEFCYRSVMEYLESFEMYANFN